MLRLGEKALDSHLPNSLSAAFKILKRQIEQGQGFTLDDFPTRPEDLQGNCAEVRLTDNFVFSTAQPTTQVPLTVQPLQDAPSGVYWHPRVAGRASYELTQMNGSGSASHSLPVVVEVSERPNATTQPSITLV